MIKLTFTDHKNQTWVRVDKRTAQKAYNNGLTVVFCPVNIRPFGFYNLEIPISIDMWGYNSTTFEIVLNDFERYNCTDNETGRYTAFYIQK